MPKTTTFGARLRAARDARQLSQSELERKSGVPSVMISQFETGLRKNPSAVTLVKLANALAVSMDYLLGRTDEPTPVGGDAAVLLRSLAGASENTMSASIAFVKTLRSQEDQAATKVEKYPRKKDG